MDLNDDENYIFITQNTFRENLAGSVDSDTASNIVDMLFDKAFADTEAENATILPAITSGRIFFFFF